MNAVTDITGGVCAPKGFQAAGLHCGISRNPNKKDLALIYSVKRCAGAAVYTKNKVQGAPITVTREHLKDGMAQAILCNSANANTCNANGVEVAKRMCESAAQELKIAPEDVVVASTGVIGQPLPVAPIETAMPQLVRSLSETGSEDSARAILTTDTFVKEIAVSFQIGDTECKIGGIAKGSGMIHPNMATMLAFLTTDTVIAPDMLRLALQLVVQDTFNMVSVDGDTSTNDMAVILANGCAGNQKIEQENEDFKAFVKALQSVCTHLARSIAKDGEGATKLLQCVVSGAPNEETARVLAKSVITSTLFKAAMFGADANWGRILCALGYADAEFDIMKTSVTLASRAGLVEVCQNGAGIPFSEGLAKQVLEQDEIEIQVDLQQGEGTAIAWGCDLTYDYVKINGDYRS